jgi:hypothetical protein
MQKTMSSSTNHHEPPTIITMKDTKKVKRDTFLRAKEEHGGTEMFFQMKDLEKAKEWLHEKFKEAQDDSNHGCEPNDYYIEECAMGFRSTDFKILYRLDRCDILERKNRETLNDLQQCCPSLTDEALEQLVHYISHNQEAALFIDVDFEI